MNILRNVRWGYTGDGMACGPVGGSIVTELTIQKEDRKLSFIRLDRMDQFVRVDIRDHSTFDSFLFEDFDGGDWRNDNAWDFDMYDFRNEIGRDDPLFHVINLGMAVLEESGSLYCSTDDSPYDPVEYEGARVFVKEWLHKDLDECDLPLFKADDDEEDDKEEGAEEE
ncbi:MAG: hypothetical protein IKP86_01685 [Anaerolineaceae bacterium]|nr:hypothetical protein [Anaerolineaceae bacterium]